MPYLNVAVCSGRLSRPARVAVLPSGDRLVALEVSVPREAERTETVPVVWIGAPAWASDLPADEGVLVLGRIRRRFWQQAGSGAQSRTELVAETVVPSRQSLRSSRLLLEAVGRLEEAVGAGPDDRPTGGPGRGRGAGRREGRHGVRSRPEGPARSTGRGAG